MEKINLTIEGDFDCGIFTMFAVKLNRNERSLIIFLTAEQTNLAIEYDDAFEPIMGLLNILLESGFTINQTIEIINGDDSEEQMQFLNDFNKIDEGWNEEVQPINLSFSDNENPDNSNIEMESTGDGYTFTIYTEANDQTPSELMDNLKFILAQN